MSNQTQQTPISKLAYASGIADTVTQAGLAKWASDEDFSSAVNAVAQRMSFDPIEDGTNEKLAGEIGSVFIKLAAEWQKEDEEKDMETETKKEREEALAKLKTDEEKKEAMAYWELQDRAARGVAKLAAMAEQGQNPGTGAQGNSLTDAAAADSVAAIDLRHRPEGHAAGAPDNKPAQDLGAQVGNKSEHPNKEDLGKTAQAILDSLTKEAAQAQQGQNPGTGAQGNALTDAAAADSLAAIDLKHRPENHAAGAPDNKPDKDLGAQVGNKSEHPNKEDLGKKTAAVTKEAFEEAARQAMMHPVFEKLSQEEKIAHCKVLSTLEVGDRRRFLDKLAETK